MTRAASVEPLDEAGQPNPDGLIVMVALGVSNTLGEFKAFASIVETEIDVNPRLVLVNGAQVGQSINRWVGSRSEDTWQTVERKLAEAAVSTEQVQVAWVKIPSAERGPPTLEDARSDAAKLDTLLTLLPEHYPNIQLAYLSSRSYGGYIPDENSEPNAYHDGFAVKWAIEAQVDGSATLNSDPSAGAVQAPWAGWGPYLWADGTTPRSDGLFYECSDYQPGGVHPADGAANKVAGLLLDHFLQHPTSLPWFSTGELAIPGTSTLPPTTTSPTEPTATQPTEAPTPTLAPPATTARLGTTTASEEGRAGLGWIAWLALGGGVGVVIGAFARRRKPPA